MSKRKHPQSRPSARIVFVTHGGEALGDVDVEVVREMTNVLLVDLLDHAGDAEYILRAVTAASMLEQLPSGLLFGSVIRDLVDVIGLLRGIPTVDAIVTGTVEQIRSGTEVDPGRAQ